MNLFIITRRRDTLTIQTIINAILILLMPFLIGWGILIERWLAQRLPDHQAPRLEQFAKMAAQNVCQFHKDNPDQKGLAISFVVLLFQDHNIPVPSNRAIDIAVGSAMFEARLPAKIG